MESKARAGSKERNTIAAIQPELIRITYSSIPLALIAIFINSIILGAVQWDVIPRTTIITWLVIANGFSLLRFLVYTKFKSLELNQQFSDFWGRFLLFSGVLSGLIWGASSIWLFPQNDTTHQVFLAFVIAGMSAGAVTTLSATLSSVTAFLIFALVPLVINFLRIDSTVSEAMGFMVLLFTIMILVTAKRLNRTIVESLLIRHEHALVEQALAESEDKYRLLFDQSADGLLILQDNQLVDCNMAAAQMMGYSSTDEFLNSPPSDLLQHKQIGEANNTLTILDGKAIAAKKGNYRFESEYTRKNGERFPVEVLLNHIPDDTNEVTHVVWRDISDRKLTEEYNYFRSNILEKLTIDSPLETILEDIVLGIERLKPNALCSILLLNENGKQLNHCTAPSLPTFYIKAIDGIELGPFAGSCGTAAYTGERVIVEDITVDARWSAYKDLALQADLAACWSEPIISSENEVLGTFAIYHRVKNLPTDGEIKLIKQSVQLISISIERKRMEQKVLKLSSLDTLTGLANRRTLETLLKHASAANARTKKRGALLFIDLDNFKTINDTLGHSVGDQLLQQTAKRLSACVRECDTVTRFGGDEFVLIIENLDGDPLHAASQARIIGEKLLHVLRKPYQLVEKEYRITSSIGLTLFDGQATSGTLIQQADIAMYQAKLSGRDSIYFFDPQMQKAIDQRVALERDMRAAIADKQFQLYYQLQINSSYHYLGAEALLRWPHPQRGMVSPLEFIPLAEESGLILPIGQWVLESACKQLKEWQKDERTRDLTLAVNVSAIQFSHPSFVNDVLSSIQSYNIAPHRLKLELTESMLANNIEEIIVIMKQLKDIGVQFSLDDFGTGYSSLQYLKKLPLDQLKIDQSFVRDLVKDTHDMSIVRTIIAMAKGLELDVIAEGVETVSQKNKLMSFGCHNFQGFLFSKPLPIEELNKKLGSQHSLLAKNPEKLEDPGIEL